MWLRDFSPALVCQQTGQKLDSVVSLPPESTKLRSANIQPSSVAVGWEDGYQCEFPTDFLWKNSFAHRLDATSAFESSLRNSNEKITLPSISFRELFPDSSAKPNEAALYEWMSSLVHHGLCLVKDVPTASGTVVALAESISPVTETLYGKCFDVICEEQPINIAYSNAGIIPHVDLQYYESPPGIQFLHCIRFDEAVTGGESLFVDGFKCAEKLRECDPQAFATLSRTPMTFQKDHMNRRNPAQMFYSRPILSLNHRGEVVGVNWSPPFEGPPRLAAEAMEEFYRSYSAFRSLVHDASSPHQLTFRLQAGECISFLQRRMLHGRQMYTETRGGVRHLQGCYLNVDDFLYRFLALRRSLPAPDLHHWRIFRVGNNDFS
jgi:alpha-ketoglutarate-dependent taurine dioxygenase